MKTIVPAILARADTGARVVAIIAAAIMVCVVTAQVVMRYGFNASFDWADEVSRLAFVTTIFVAIPLGIRDGTHVGIDLLVDRLPVLPRRLVKRFTSALAGVMLLIVTWATFQVAGATWSERMGAINVTSAVFFFPVIAGVLHSALHLLHMAADPDTQLP
ncbi:TRAP transporter small permease [Mesobacterium pallidum]|uniref:TRAP transporter small permease n=1 Tax=Mesobacterium pallidum TaxID=2872037 RepID=UPI001EE31523|nr:TRAP transporter small permease [Mesobacterium pallidum]